MNLHARLSFLSIAIGAVLTVALIFLRSALSGYELMGNISDAALWPLVLFERLSPAPRLLPNGGREGTPIQLIAGVAGAGMTWAYYSSIFFLLGRLRRRNDRKQ